MRSGFLLCSAAFATLSFAQEIRPEYPARPVRLIVPSSVGSPPDVVGRMMGETLAATLGKPIVPDNRAGATGIIGLEIAAKAAGDGYTLAVLGMPFVVITHLVSKVPYNIERDFTAVAQVALHYHMLAVRSDTPVSSVRALVDAAHARPNALKFSSGGNGTPAHLSSLLFMREAKLRLQHIPYRAAPPAAQALLSGEVDLMIGSVAMLASHVKAGKLRPLATPAPQRIAAHPEVPTFAEAGYPGVRLHDWIGIVAPAGTPSTVVARLNSEIEQAVRNPEIKRRLESMGMEPAHAGPETFGQHIRAELKRWKTLVREIGVTAD